MLRFLLLGVLITASQADRLCKGVYFNQRYYEIDILKEGINNVHKMALNYNDNKLFFTFDQVSLYPTRLLAFYDLKTRTVGLVDGIRNATGVAIDQMRNRIYVGGSDGLYVIDNNLPHPVPQKLPVDDDIRNLFFKDFVYYCNGKREGFKFEDGEAVPLYELFEAEVDDLILDDDNNILFLQGNKLFRVKLGTRIVNSHEHYNVTALAVDAFLKPYVCTTDGVYVYNKYKYALDRVANLRNLRAFVAQRNQEPIYTVQDTIVKLNVSKPCHETYEYSRL